MVSSFLTRAYVPLATLLLTVVLTTLLARWSRQFDPLTAAPDPRLQSKGSEEMPAGEAGAPAQDEEASAVLDPEPVLEPDREQLLYLGNSQTTMIVDAGPGDLVAAQWLQVLLEQRGVPVAVHLAGAGGMTMPEIFLRLVAGGEHRPREADVAVISSAIDEFRKLGIRDDIAALAEDPAVKARLAQLCHDNPDLPYAITAIRGLLSAPAIAAGLEPASSALAQRVENRLQRVAKRWPFLAQRDKLDSQIVLTCLRVRDDVFGITPASLRPIPGTAYRTNLQLLELACRYARAQGVRLTVYLSPERHTQPSPDAPEDLERMRRDVPRLCRQYGVLFFNYTDLVPEGLWSKYAVNVINLRAGVAGQPDFVHLTGAGHRLLVERLMSDITAQVIAAPHGQAQVRHP